MSIQNLARQMKSQGRGPDSMLVHMSPKELQGLQALAMAQGGSLTINPVTGLPEAGMLDDFLPAIIGFALDTFAPGVGSTVGDLVGLSSAAGTALTVGGIAGLASGSLEDGIKAGLGAYGGASLSSGLGNMGQTANMKDAYDAAASSGMDSSDSFMASLDKATPDVSRGIAAAANAPKDFLKDNKLALAALAAPLLMGSSGKKDGPTATASPGYIRTMKRDPVTGQIYQESATPTSEFGNRPTGTFGGVPARMAAGGEVDSSRFSTFLPAPYNPADSISARYGRQSPPPPEKFGSTTKSGFGSRLTDSERAYDYLMGVPGATNPMLFGSGLPLDYKTRIGGNYKFDPVTKTYTWVPSDTTKTTDTTTNKPIDKTADKTKINESTTQTGGGGGSGGGSDTSVDSNPGWTSLTDQQKSDYYAANPTMSAITQALQGLFGYTGLGKLQNMFDPSIQNREGLIAQGFNFDKYERAQDAFRKGEIDAFNQEALVEANAMNVPTQEDTQNAFSTYMAANATNVPTEQEALNAFNSYMANALAPAPISPTYEQMYTTFNAKTPGYPSIVGLSQFGQEYAAAVDARAEAEQQALNDALNAMSARQETQMNLDAQTGGSRSFGGENTGTISVADAMQSMQDALAADTAAVNSMNDSSNTGVGNPGESTGPTSSESGVGNPGESDSSSDSSSSGGGDGDSSSSDSSSSGGGDGDGEARGGLNMRGRYYPPKYAHGGIAALAYGGLGSLNGYSDGGRLLRGPGDGVSDSIPARIGKRPARLADGEFVIPARIVSELGNGSTEAGARQLYAMLDRIQAGRKKTVGKNKTAVNSKSVRHLPA